MSKTNEQIQLLKIDKFLSQGKIDLAIKIADDNIKNKISPTQFLKFIKKTLIKNQIIDKAPSILKLENLFKENKFTCAKYYFQTHAKIFFKNPNIFSNPVIIDPKNIAKGPAKAASPPN